MNKIFDAIARFINRSDAGDFVAIISVLAGAIALVLASFNGVK